MIVSHTRFKNGAFCKVYYYRQLALKRHFPYASTQDVIRLQIGSRTSDRKPIGDIDYLMTPGEAIDTIAGLSLALQEALTDEVSMFHEDKK